MNKRICFFTYNLFGLGGIQRVVSVVASALCKYYDVYILCFDKPETENRTTYNLSHDVKVIYANNNNCTLRKILRKLNQKSGILDKVGSSNLLDYAYILPEEQKLYKQVLNHNKINIAVAVGAFESCILGSITKDINCKTVGWQHNSYKAYYETPGMACWGMKYIIDKYLPMLDKFIVLNEYDQKQFLEKRNFKCETIHNPKSFVCNQQAKLQNKNFIAAGRFIYAKGFDLLLNAFEIFARSNSEWTLTIYGTGDGMQKIKDKISTYHLNDRVFLPGFSDNMSEKLMESSCYLLSSRWEGMPMVILEALEIGLPIISFDISAMIPLVDDGIEGIIVRQFDCEEFANAMLKLAQNYELRLSMGTSARKKAQLFTIEKITEKWRYVLENL